LRPQWSVAVFRGNGICVAVPKGEKAFARRGNVHIHASNPMPTIKPNQDVCLCMTLRCAARAATRLYDELMQPSGLKITQFSLLRNIERAGTISVTELARKLELERTAMGRNLDLIERRGWIRNEGLEGDQRTRLVTLTDAGRETLEAATPVWKRAQTEMRRRLQKGRFAALGAVLETITAA